MDARLVTQLGDARGELMPALEASLGDARVVIDRLVWAASLDRCDWGIDYSAGLDTPLPHLSELRDLARLLRAEAQRAVRAGDSAAAVADVVSLIRMSAHVGGKATIESLVAFGVLNIATDLVTENSGVWSGEDRAMLREALQEINAGDPLGGNANLAWDKRISAREQADGPDEALFRQAQQKTTNALRAAVAAVE